MTPHLRPAAACTALLFLTACSSEHIAHGMPAVVSPSASAPVVQGKGGKLPDDVNGDGYPDLQIPSRFDRRVTFVYGSSDGLKPRVQTELGRREFGFPPDARTQDPGSIADVVTADLDDDGFPDFVGTSMREREPDERIRYKEHDRTDPYVAWGTPAGRPRPGRKATPLALPGELAGRGIHTQPAAGDFDGDGHADLALDSGPAVTLLYGPFNRSGEPARTGTRPLAHPGAGRLLADRTAPGRATGLLVQYGNADGQSKSLYFTGAAGDIAPTGRELRAGNAAAFGDFDGDGRRDLAVADDGARATEPGSTPEGRSIAETVTVYFGDDKTLSFRVRGSRALVAADTDGDGRDELAVAVNRRPRSSGSGQEFTEVLRLDHSGVKGRHRLQRTMPERVDGTKLRPSARTAWLYAGTDLDANGKNEIVLDWGAADIFSVDGGRPTHWWITNGRSDLLVFTTLWPLAGQ